MDEARIKTKQLVDKYHNVVNSGQTKGYTEEETKKDFIQPLFWALGWNVASKEEVTAEEAQSSGRVDYGFYLDGRIKFYLEAKALKADLHNEDYAKQAIRYSWNKGVDWAILTDFEGLKVFYCQDPTQSLFSKLVFEISFDEYIDQFDQLWLLSKESFRTNELDTYAQKHGKRMQKVSVGDQLYKHLNECRKVLIEKLGIWNGIKDQNLLDEGVQRLLDRLIFVRVAEDRGIEPPTLIPLLRAWENDKSGRSLYESMVSKFREFDEIYNSNLFSEHPFEKWGEAPGVTENVIEILQGKAGYYEYDFKAMSADILGAVYENYLGHRLAESQKGVVLDKSAKKRKEQGIYYTPEFIVDYIVRNSLKPVLDKCKTINDLKKIKVLDPACGSGSFLIKALQVINEKYKEFGNPGNEFTKIAILLENICGVDLDEQAVEIARLNLLLSTLETKMKLPKLDKNIKVGNSLISGTDEALKKYFGKNYRDKKPFNWEEEFPEVFKQGGFDVIIGNPPYGAELNEFEKKYFYERSVLSEYQLDTYILFIEKCVELLKKEGELGFIIPNTWLTNIKVTKFRKFLLENTTIEEINNYSQKIFPAATVDSIVLIFTKKVPQQDHEIKISLINLSDKKNNQILQSQWKEASVFNIFTNSESKTLLNKVESNTKPLSDLCKVTVGLKPYQKGKGSPRQTQDVVDKRIYDADRKVDKTYRLYLRGRDIRRYGMSVNKSRWISYGPWLAEPRDKDLFEDKEKIVIRQTGDSLIATIDKNRLLCLNNLHTINRKKKGIDLNYILGLLNSNLLNFYFQYLNPEKGEALAEVKATNVKRLPIKEINSNNKEIHNKIVRYVDVMLTINKKIEGITENSNKWNEIKSEIEKIDKQIDEEVFKLYGLMPEEIAIVEGKNGNF